MHTLVQNNAFKIALLEDLLLNSKTEKEICKATIRSIDNKSDSDKSGEEDLLIKDGSKAKDEEKTDASNVAMTKNSS